MDTKEETLGQRLRKLRLHLGKYQATLAKELGITNSALSRYENDMRGADAEFLTQLRKITGVDLHWLLCGEGKMFARVPRETGPKIALAQKILSHANEIVQLLTELKRF